MLPAVLADLVVSGLRCRGLRPRDPGTLSFAPAAAHHQLNLRFEERLGERTRIAQELHDTLLQGFLSASMQLHVAVDRLPADSPVRPSMGRVLQLMSQVIEEGRNAVRGLRSPQSASAGSGAGVCACPAGTCDRG